MTKLRIEHMLIISLCIYIDHIESSTGMILPTSSLQNKLLLIYISYQIDYIHSKFQFLISNYI